MADNYLENKQTYKGDDKSVLTAGSKASAGSFMS